MNRANLNTPRHNGLIINVEGTLGLTMVSTRFVKLWNFLWPDGQMYNETMCTVTATHTYSPLARVSLRQVILFS